MASLNGGSRKINVVLVHGVGNPQIDELRNSTLKPMAEAGINADQIHEFNWNTRVPKPFLRAAPSAISWTNYSYIAGVGRGMLNAMLVPFERPTGSWRSGIAQACEFFSLVLQASPAALLTLPFLFYKPTQRAEELVIGAFLCMSCFILVLGLISFSVSILMQAIRVALLPHLWMALFFLLVPANVSWPLLIGAGIAFFLAPLVASHLPDWASPLGREDPDQDHLSTTGMDLATFAFGNYTRWVFPYLIVGGAMWGVSVYAIVNFLERVFFVPLKILADVALYLGDVEYRRTLIDALSNDLEELASEDTELILVTHSLGTVITVDSLRELQELRFNRVVLITAGSPLARMFTRFFPARYPAAKVLYQEFSKSFKRFRWLNVYRPLDPIGSSLGLPPDCELSTRQWRRLLMAAHADYWSDPVAYKMVAPLIAVTSERFDHGASQSAAGSLTDSLNFSRAAIYIRRMALGCATVIPLLIYLWTYRTIIISLFLEMCAVFPELRRSIGRVDWGGIFYFGWISVSILVVTPLLAMGALWMIAYLLSTPPVSIVYSLFGLDNQWWRATRNED